MLAVVLLVIAGLSLQACGPSDYDQADAAIDSLERMNSKLTVGMNYDDYTIALGELKADTDAFQRSVAGQKLPVVAERVNAATVALVDAKVFWDFKIAHSALTVNNQPNAENLPEWTAMMERYPLLREKVITAKPDGNQPESTYLSADDALQFLWSVAEGRTTAARKNLE